MLRMPIARSRSDKQAADRFDRPRTRSASRDATCPSRAGVTINSELCIFHGVIFLPENSSFGARMFCAGFDNS